MPLSLVFRGGAVRFSFFLAAFSCQFFLVAFFVVFGSPFGNKFLIIQKIYILLQINELEELRNEAYDNAIIYKDKTKKWHYQKILRGNFKAGELILLYNSKFKLFLGKLKSRWSGPYTVVASTPFGAMTLKTNPGNEFKMNGQRLKHYFGVNINED